MKAKRKLQVSNGHYFENDHLARILNIIKTNNQDQINLTFIEKETGLPLRQVRNRISIGRALGLFKGISFKLSEFGDLVATYDLFIDFKETIEFMHYKASTDYNNLIWYELFNSVFHAETAMTYEKLTGLFRNKLFDQYSEKSLIDHLTKELRFLIDLYFEKNFKKLRLLYKDMGGNISMTRYKDISPLILTAMLYDYCEKKDNYLIQIDELLEFPGSPAVVFRMDSAFFREKVENLHEEGWLRYETTHSLDQIRLKSAYSSFDFLRAFYEETEPLMNDKNKTVRGELF